MEEIDAAAGSAVEHVRSTGRPFFLVLDTYRFSPHSKGDDFRDPAEIEARRERDPLTVAGARLADDDRREIEAAVERASSHETLERAEAGSRLELRERACAERCVHVLNEALFEVFEAARRRLPARRGHPRPLRRRVQGHRGPQHRWPDRVLTTPISEASLFGVAAGLALRGYRPILEIMFGDFIALGFDQIVNGIAKFREMFDEQVTVPLVVRTPMGGGRGYGPTHSQSLEKLLIGVPGICVVAAERVPRPARVARPTPSTTIDPSS